MPFCMSELQFLSGGVVIFVCAIYIASLYQMDLVVRQSTPDAIYGVWIVHSEWIDLLPRHTIILDQSHCTSTTHTWPSQLFPHSTSHTPPTNMLDSSQPASHQGLSK